MAADTPIEWTDKSWNPGRGCSRVSAGCDNCYAMQLAYRFKGPGLAYEGLATLRKGKADWTGIVREIPEALDAPIHWRDPKLIFVNSQTDLFHEGFTNEFIAAVFGVMAATPWHRYQILTKRAERMRQWFLWIAESGAAADPALFVQRMAHARIGKGFPLHPVKGIYKAYPWPLPNVMLGVSAEDQETANARIPHLLATPATRRMVSVEPQLEFVDLAPFLRPPLPGCMGPTEVRVAVGLDWVIVGGESGNAARAFEIEWAESLRDQCRAAGVAFFMKQYGAKPVRGGARLYTKKRKGTNMSDWDKELRVREYPPGFEPMPPRERKPSARREEQTVWPLKKTLDPAKSYSVFRERPGHPNAPDKIWSFEAADEADARSLMARVIPEAELPRCTLVKDAP